MDQISSEGANHPTLADVQQHTASGKWHVKWLIFFILVGVVAFIGLCIWIVCFGGHNFEASKRWSNTTTFIKFVNFFNRVIFIKVIPVFHWIHSFPLHWVILNIKKNDCCGIWIFIKLIPNIIDFCTKFPSNLGLSSLRMQTFAKFGPLNNWIQKSTEKKKKIFLK